MLETIAEHLNVDSRRVFLDMACDRGGPGLWIARETGAKLTGVATQVILKMLLYALIGYAILLLIVFVFQRKLLYMPSQFRLSEKHVIDEGLHYWPSYEKYRGFIGPDGSVDGKGTIVVFHGNAGTAYDRGFYVKALAPLGLRVILVEYPGYGGRAGRPSEDALVKDALETIGLAYREYGKPLFLWGESLGSGVVSSAVSLTDIPLKGVVLFTPWDSLSSVAQTHYWYLPARWLVLDKYDNIDNLRRFEGNVAVILAGNDEVVPVRHGRKLYDSMAANKRLWTFDRATHNEMPIEPGLPWWEDVLEFISQ
jgi:pimeloyl-ACP methyl ester carboxylesterase